MTQATPSYYQDLNTLVRFLTRADENGYVFAVAEHQGMIPQINQMLLDKVAAQGKTIHTFDFDLESEDSIMEQLREYIESDPPSEALILKNLDDCLRLRGNDFLQELNFSREAIHQLGIPLVCWVSKENLARISNQAADLFSQRRLTTVIFEADETLLAPDGHLESRFLPEYRSTEDYDALTLKVNLLKKQLHDAETGGYARTRIVRDIVLPLATSYSELDLHQPALELLHTYADALPLEDADQLIDIGDVYGNARQYDAATSRYKKAIELLEKENIQKERLSYVYVQIGDLYKKLGNFIEAEHWFVKNLALSETLEKNTPTEHLKNRLAIAYERLGDLWQAKGDFDKALDFFDKRAQLGEELSRANPHSEDLQNGLAISYSRLGDLWQAKGDFDKALDFFEKYNQHCEALYRANPHSESLGYNLCISYERLGDMWKAKGNFDKALEFFEKLNGLIEKLHLANSFNEQIKNELAISYNKLGLLWLAQKEPEKAFDFIEKDLALKAELAVSNPHSFNLKNNHCYSWRDMGDVLVALERQEEALAFYQKAEAGWQALWEQTPLPSIQEALEALREDIAALGDKKG